MIDIRLPQITAPTEAGQLTQIKSYLYQFAEQLQWALSAVDEKIEQTTAETAASNEANAENEAATTFNSIKALIIKSADIVNAYSEEIGRRLEGVYVAQSDFGEYQEVTDQQITANSTGIEQILTDIQTISGTVDGLYDSVIETNAYIKSGLLYYTGDDPDTGAAVYGLEIGQTNTIDDVETFNKFARFTADRLSFYDNNDTEVAYVSDYKLFITNAEITGSLKLGGYKIDTADGLAFVWEGRS